MMIFGSSGKVNPVRCSTRTSDPAPRDPGTRTPYRGTRIPEHGTHKLTTVDFPPAISPLLFHAQISANKYQDQANAR